MSPRTSLRFAGWEAFISVRLSRPSVWAAAVVVDGVSSTKLYVNGTQVTSFSTEISFFDYLYIRVPRCFPENRVSNPRSILVEVTLSKFKCTN